MSTNRNGNDNITNFSTPDTNRVIQQYPNVSTVPSFPLSNNNNNNNNNVSLQSKLTYKRDGVVSIRVDNQLYSEFKDVLWKNRMKISLWLEQKIEEEIKNNTIQTPNEQLDRYVDPDFVATPEFFWGINSWDDYLEKLDDEGFKKWDIQLNELLRLSNKHNKRKFH